MPKRTDIKSVLIIGAGPIIIGQACEFDYSGAQACKALKAEGFRVILFNSNPATISMEEALSVQESLGFPCIIRPSFTLGGSGGGVAYNIQEFKEICEKGLDLSPTTELLIDESLLGWKEYELEVVRDKNDNCIIICSIENLDPMGVHTGDSITVAPAQTLTDKEYQILRDQSFKILREIGVETGGSNVQFGINPENGRVVVIEMNPRVSRSSALASKATGFPIAKVAALLSVGFTLDELQNDITNGLTPASFEPSIDYIVTKIPKFAFEKFPQANDRLTTQMKSVGEVMGIGRTFQESLQKALQSLEEDLNGFESILDDTSNQNETLRYQLTFPGSRRILYVGDAIRLGWDADQLNQLTGIDFWFLQQIIDLVDEENILQDMKLQEIDFHKMLNLKQKGFADHRIAKLTKSTAQDVRDLRKKLGVMPSFKRVDTCAAEFATETAYMYSTYEGECESRPTNNKKVIVLGSGPNRIGQGIEFDYCCVHASFALQEEGYESIMINCNPETVSTDYDTSNRLYFEPITEEKVLDIIDLEKPEGVIIQFGGQTPLKLSETLLSNNVTILGTDVDAIDRSEDRERFQSLAHQLNLKQPPNSTVKNLGEALQMSEEIGFPIVVRPSYVLGGRAMELVHTQVELEKYLKEAVEVSDQKPILLDGYLTDAIEVDVDVISDGGDIEIGGILQHIEQAGIHSGDSACSLPPYSLSKKVIQEIEIQAKKIAKELNVVGLMNIQFAVQDEDVFIIEVNPRASRTVPFISKCIGESLVKSATKTMVGKTLKDIEFSNELPMNYFFVKEAVLPFDKFPAVDPILGPEMKSTGEVMGIGSSFGEAYAKAQRAANKVFPESGLAFISVKESDKKYLPNLIPMLVEHGFSLIATKGTANSIKALGYDAQIINKVTEGRPHIVDELLNNRVNLLINTTEGRQSIEDSASIRRTALQNKLFCVTTIFGAFALLEAMSTNSDNWIYNSLQEIN